MTSDLMQAYIGIFKSAEEIIKNNQKHLYVNMLDLIARTTKTITESSEKCITDNYITFWLSKIVPLMFDENKDIQINAIQAVENAVHCFNMSEFHSHPDWPSIKINITQNYAEEIHKFRQTVNSNWHRIWCVLVRILNKEILKGATIINTYLSIVELGFRSNDYNIRSEAFLCWKVLIEIFSEHDEFTSQKRIKLICIPLKSSHCKTVQAAKNKLNVWWYLICKMQEKLELNSEQILEPFLTFCFGEFNHESKSAVRLYKDIHKMATMCLLMMLGPNNNDFRSDILSADLIFTSALLNDKTIEKHFKHIVNAVFEIISLSDGSENALLNGLINNLLLHFFKYANLDTYNYCLDKLKSLHDDGTSSLMSAVIVSIGIHQKFPWEFPSSDLTPHSILQVNNIFLKMFYSPHVIFKRDTLKDVIANIYNFEKYNRNSNWNLIKLIFEKDMEKSESSEYLKNYLTWLTISKQLINEQISPNSTTLTFFGRWIMWPLQSYTEEKNKENEYFDELFCNTWENLIKFTSDLEGKYIFNKILSPLLKDILKSKKEVPNIDKLIIMYINNIVTNTENISLPHETFDFIEYILSLPPLNKDSSDSILQAFQNFICSYDEIALISIFDSLKLITSSIKAAEKSQYISRKAFNEYKTKIQEKVSRIGNMSRLKEIRNILTCREDFVIIPSVWTLNPDKLTERQKEKINAKRNDIPALYNDISQSEDSSSIKPWTPNKIVIVKAKQDEIILNNEVALSAKNFAIKENILPAEIQQNSKDCIDISNNSKSISQDLINKTISTDERNVQSEIKHNAELKKNNSNDARESSTNERNAQSEISHKAELQKDNSIEARSYEIISDCMTTTLQCDNTSNGQLKSPDRNETSSNISPSIKNKIPPIRLGRGAQFINMIRKKNNLLFAQNINSQDQNEDTNDPNLLLPKIIQKPQIRDINSNSSRILPPINSSSSPSSILKRKFKESFDDTGPVSSHKRKRVSFHDPPVSATKEYISTCEDDPTNKCTLSRNQLRDSVNFSPNLTAKHLLRRKSRADSIIELKKYSNETLINKETSITHHELLSSVENNNFKRSNISEKSKLNHFDRMTDENDSEHPQSALQFTDDQSVFNYLFEKYNFDAILDRFIAVQKDSICVKPSRMIVNILKNLIEKDQKLKAELFENLSEHYPKEFLNCAIRENLSSTVCNELNSDSIIDFLCNSSKLNDSIRNTILSKLNNLLIEEKFHQDINKNVKLLLEHTVMTNEEILNCIEIMTSKRQKFTA